MSTRQSTTQTTWPEGVIARYLTVGGAAVDITTSHKERQVGEYGTRTNGTLSYQTRPETVIDLTVTIQCHGCTDNTKTEYEGLHPSASDRPLENFRGKSARAWAQAHAETCRAMPRPTT